MKIAFLSESPADEAAVSILIQGILGVEIEPVALPSPKTRGWKGTLNAVGLAIRHLHYRTDAEALVITLDSDESPMHRSGVQPSSCHPRCRLCQLRTSVDDAQGQVKARQGCGPIKIGLGMAVPAIEAWCLCGTDPHITESAWFQSLPSHQFPYTKKELKQRLYGTPDPVLEFETERLVERAKQLVDGGELSRLEKLFPVGFGSLAEEVRSWIT
jgi:hypothetical protein